MKPSLAWVLAWAGEGNTVRIQDDGRARGAFKASSGTFTRHRAPGRRVGSVAPAGPLPAGRRTRVRPALVVQMRAEVLDGAAGP